MINYNRNEVGKISNFKMIIIFRVDSSNIIGGGHLTRCINIANQLKKRKVNSIFLCQDLPGLDIKLLKIYNLKYKLLPENKDFTKDAKETIKFLIEESLNPDCLVIDHYEIDIKWEKKVKQYTKKLLIIDDIALMESYSSYTPKPRLYGFLYALSLSSSSTSSL